MLTDYVKSLILNAMAGLGSINTQGVTIPYGYKLGLSSTTPNADGSNFTEPASAAGYQRVNIRIDNPYYPFEIDPQNSHVARNKDEIHFNVATANWGNPLTHIGIFDNANHLLAYGLLVDDQGDPAPITVLKDHIPTVLAHQAKITIDVE